MLGCVGATALSIILVISLVPLALATSSGNDTSNATSASELQNNKETCSTWVGIAPEEGSENNTEIPCLQKVLDKCQPFDVTLGYLLGSMRVSIKGVTNNGSNNCSLNLQHEIERGQTNMTCMVPLARLSSWTNWKRGDGPDAVDQIIKYCNVTR